MMPKLDGFEVCRRLKHYRKAAPIPILMITALSEREERLMGIQAGANDFLHKPIDIEDVILRVGNAVYAKRLYDQLQVEQQKSEVLLFSLLPKAIAERMKNGESNIAENFSDATILFADLVGFTALSAHVSPDEVVSLLNEIFSAFDVLVDKHGLEKIKTIGDGYMVAGGVPLPRSRHAEAVADLALDMETEIERLNLQYATSIRIRIGINTGQVVAGVIGQRRPAYDLWGDSVNVASRLASLGEAGRIQMTEATYCRLRDDYWFDAPRTMEIKGRGEVVTYALRGRKARMEEMGLLSA
jgi:class 3 adenylate cyclase